MRKVYKNDVYRIISEVMKFDPSKFSLTDSVDGGLPTTTISIIGSEMKFIFRNPTTSWEHFDIRYIRFAPNNELTKWLPPTSYFDYQDASKIFTQWLTKDAKNFIEEQELPDNWSSFQFETSMLDLAQIRFNDNSNFNIEESSSIANSIDSLKQLLIEKFEPNKEQLEFINERLEYLTEACTRLGKFDWTNTLISVMISIAINMSFDTETGKKFFMLIKQAFQSIGSLFNS